FNVSNAPVLLVEKREKAGADNPDVGAEGNETAFLKLLLDKHAGREADPDAILCRCNTQENMIENLAFQRLARVDTGIAEPRRPGRYPASDMKEIIFKEVQGVGDDIPLQKSGRGDRDRFIFEEAHANHSRLLHRIAPDDKVIIFHFTAKFIG